MPTCQTPGCDEACFMVGNHCMPFCRTHGHIERHQPLTVSQERVDELRSLYLAGGISALADYCDMIRTEDIVTAMVRRVA